MNEDIVIEHIRSLFNTGKLEPGDRLPAERKIAELLGVSRAHVRSAYQKLEIYGIAKTYPQSGTVLSDGSVQALSSQFSGLIKVKMFDFASLVHVRTLLETEAVRLAVKHATAEDIELIRSACQASMQNEDPSKQYEMDLEFHQSIAQSSGNPVISSLLLVITPDVLSYYRKHQLCTTSIDITNAEHSALCDAIGERDLRLALRILKEHFRGITELSAKLS